MSLERRFPRLRAYLAELPGGVMSYASCTAKASILRVSLEVTPWSRFEPDLPTDLKEVLREPPPVNAWVPEALSVAAHYAIADANQMTDDEVVAWQSEANRRLSNSKLYRSITKLSSPRALLRGAPTAWHVLHRGVKLQTHVDGSRATLTVRHPSGLWNHLVHRCTATGFAAVLESCRGADVSVTLVDSRSDGADYESSWR